MRLALAVAILLFTVAQPALAQGEQAMGSANEFLRRCSPGITGPEPSTIEGHLDTTYCLGHLAGFLDAAMLVQAHLEVKLFCLPTTGIETDQFGRIAVKWMEDHPAQLHLSARIMILLSLQDAFPCLGATPSRR